MLTIAGSILRNMLSLLVVGVVQVVSIFQLFLDTVLLEIIYIVYLMETMIFLMFLLADSPLLMRNNFRLSGIRSSTMRRFLIWKILTGMSMLCWWEMGLHLRVNLPELLSDTLKN